MGLDLFYICYYNILNMKVIQSINILLCLFVITACNSPAKNEVSEGFGQVREARGYYKEGDKRYKIFRGGEFKTNEVSSFKSLFPVSINDAVSSRIALQVYQGLFKLNQRTLKVEPLLAKKMNVSDDGKTYTFTLHDSIYFHNDSCFDNLEGRELNANDVKFCFDMLCSAIEGNSTYSYFTEIVVGAKAHYDASLSGATPDGGVEGIKVIDDRTIQIELISSYSYFLKILSQSCCTIYPKEAYEKYGAKMRAHTVGTGPFILKNKDIEENVELSMIRNKNYWQNDENGNSLPYLDRLKIYFNSNKKVELANFRKGKLEMVYQLPGEELNEVLVSLDSAKDGGNPEFKLQSNKDNGLSTSFYCFNMLKPIFQNSDVRKAFNLAIDREKITKYTLHGEGEAAIYGLVPSLGDYDHTKVKGFDYNPQEATRLLAKAGYPNGKGFPKVELDVSEGNYLNKNVAEAIQKMLSDNLGIAIGVNYYPFSELINKFNNGKSDFWGITWLADYPDPQNFLQIFNGAVVPSDDEVSYTNHSRYKNPLFDEYYDNAIHAKNQQQAMSNYYKADSILIADAAFLPIYYEHKIRLIQNNVHALPMNSMEYRDFTGVFLSKK